MPDLSEFPRDFISLVHSMYGDRLLGEMSQRISQTNDSITSRRTQCEAIRADLDRHTFELERIQTQQTIARDRLRSTLRLIAEEVYLLYQVPGITSVKMVPGALHVYTKDLLVRDEMTNIVHKLGEFRIDLLPVTSVDQYIARAFNLEGVINLKGELLAAPRFRADGRFRTDDASPAPLPEDVTEDIKQLRFSHAAQRIIGLLTESLSTKRELEVLRAFPTFKGANQ